MSDVLIEQLYSSDECRAIRSLYKDDTTTHKLIQRAIGEKIVCSSETIITTKPLDVICLICLTAKFAASEDECHRIAITVYQYHDKPNEQLPLITEDQGLVFASKTLMALSFRAKALEKRWKQHGAPSPSYYRQASKLTYSKFKQQDIAEHHEMWEGFLGEYFI